MRLLLTGANGFTGCHIIPAAQKSGYELKALTCDLTNQLAVIDEVARIRPTHVIHLAGISAVTHANEEDFYRVNLFGTQSLLLALDALPEVPEKILLASSANVYGNALVSPVSELTCPQPVNHYAISKLSMEFMAASFFKKLPIVIGRPFNYTGILHDNRFVVPKIVEHFKRKESEIELGNLNVMREYNDVRVICKAYLDLLKLGVPGEIYNIASGNPVSLSTIISTMEKVTKHSIHVRVNPAFVRSNEIEVLSGSAVKIENLIGPLKHPALEDTLSWMLGGN